MNYNYYSNDIKLVEKSIILCQPGFFDNGEKKNHSLNPLFDKLKNDPLNVSFSCEYCEETMQSFNDIASFKNSSVYRTINSIFSVRKTNLFVETVFNSTSSGDLDSQVNELIKIVDLINSQFSDVPVILLGFDIGGVVNCYTAIRSDVKIDKIINIATPHRGLIDIIPLMNLSKSIINSVGFDSKSEEYEPSLNAILSIIDDFSNGKLNELFNNVFYKNNLENDWNNCKHSLPKLVTIAASPIKLNGIENDFLINTEGALAKNFKNLAFKNRINDFNVNENQIIYEKDATENLFGSFNTIIIKTLKESIEKYGSKKDVLKMKVLFILSDIIISLYRSKNVNIKKALSLSHYKNDFGYILDNQRIERLVYLGING